MEKVKISTEFITLGQFLKYVGLISNGGQAKTFLNEAKITINKERDDRRGRKLYPKDEICVNKAKYIIE